MIAAVITAVMVKTFGGEKGEGMDLTNSVYRLGKKGGESAKNYKNKWRLSFRWVDDSGRRRQKDYGFRTEQDAKDAMKVKSDKRGLGQGWIWRMTGDPEP